MRENPQIAVYIMASQRNGTLYIGVTSDVFQRVIDHKTGRHGGFTSDHACKMLVWFERHAEMLPAIAQEKDLKRWRREWKLNLIERLNPDWRDLSDDWFDTTLPHLSLKVSARALNPPDERLA